MNLPINPQESEENVLCFMFIFQHAKLSLNDLKGLTGIHKVIDQSSALINWIKKQTITYIIDNNQQFLSAFYDYQ